MYLPKPSKLQTEKEEQGGYFYKHNTIRVGASYSMAGKQRVIATCIKLDTHFIDLTIDLFQYIYVYRNIGHIKILQTKFLKLTKFPQFKVNNCLISMSSSFLKAMQVLLNITFSRTRCLTAV